MKRSTFALCTFVFATRGFAAAAEPADPLSYDDPAMHFAAPPGWERVRFTPSTTEDSSHPVAIFAKDRGEYDQRTIAIEVGRFDGTFDSVADVHASELRTQFDHAFIDHKARVVLPNGMPAWWQRVSYGQELGHIYERYEYVLFDGRRSIVVSYTAHLGDADDKDAKAALSSLSVVLYPNGR